jgi:hypothetical protein
MLKFIVFSYQSMRFGGADVEVVFFIGIQAALNDRTGGGSKWSGVHWDGEDRDCGHGIHILKFKGQTKQALL